MAKSVSAADQSPAPGFDIGAESAAKVRHAVAECRRHLLEVAGDGLHLDGDQAAELTGLVTAISPAKPKARK